MSSVGTKEVSGQQWDSQVLKSEKPVLVDFYADWCGPCKMLAPLLDKLAKEFPQIDFLKLNIENAQDIAGRYNISSIPSVKVFKKGEVVSQFVGLKSEADLRSFLKGI